MASNKAFGPSPGGLNGLRIGAKVDGPLPALESIAPPMVKTKFKEKITVTSGGSTAAALAAASMPAAASTATTAPAVQTTASAPTAGSMAQNVKSAATAGYSGGYSGGYQDRYGTMMTRDVAMMVRRQFAHAPVTDKWQDDIESHFKVAAFPFRQNAGGIQYTACIYFANRESPLHLTPGNVIYRNLGTNAARNMDVIRNGARRQFPTVVHEGRFANDAYRVLDARLADQKKRGLLRDFKSYHSDTVVPQKLTVNGAKLMRGRDEDDGVVMGVSLAGMAKIEHVRKTYDAASNREVNFAVGENMPSSFEIYEHVPGADAAQYETMFGMVSRDDLVHIDANGGHLALTSPLVVYMLCQFPDLWASYVQAVGESNLTHHERSIDAKLTRWLAINRRFAIEDPDVCLDDGRLGKFLDGVVQDLDTGNMTSSWHIGSGNGSAFHLILPPEFAKILNDKAKGASEHEAFRPEDFDITVETLGSGTGRDVTFEIEAEIFTPFAYGVIKE